MQGRNLLRDFASCPVRPISDSRVKPTPSLVPLKQIRKLTPN
jgi:hypothetical protein